MALTETMCFHECVLPLRSEGGDHMLRVFAAQAPSREVAGGFPGSAREFPGTFTGIPGEFPGIAPGIPGKLPENRRRSTRHLLG